MGEALGASVMLRKSMRQLSYEMKGNTAGTASAWGTGKPSLLQERHSSRASGLTGAASVKKCAAR
jgi:hypothetical protein